MIAQRGDRQTGRDFPESVVGSYRNAQLPDPGVEKVEEVEQIAITEGPWDLDDEDRRRIAEIKGQLGTRSCRQCEYCGPCPQGVIIHGVLYLQRLHALWPPEHYFNWAYVTRAVESVANCIECGECEKSAPSGCRSAR